MSALRRLILDQVISATLAAIVAWMTSYFPYIKNILWIYIGEISSLSIFLIVYGSAIFSIMLIYVFLYFSAKANLLRYQRCNDNFLEFSEANSLVDKKLFDYLFIKISDILSKDDAVKAAVLSQSKIIATSIVISQINVRDNIFQTLATASNLLGHFSNAPCTASLKIISGAAADGVLTVKTLDRKSHVQSSRPWVIQKIDETPLSKVMKSNKIFMCNNIDKSYSKKPYVDADRSDDKFYKSIIIAPIYDISADRRNETIVGFLQADSPQGGIANATCGHFVTELSWRLAIMLYRMNTMRQHSSKFEEE